MKNEKRKKIYSTDFKLKFMGYGEWIDEPDELEFEYKGIKCLIVRMLMKEPYALEEAYFGGYLCGYIFLPECHPLYGKELADIDIDCYVEITFSELSKEGWVIGFACGHLGDIVPTSEHIKKSKELFPTPEVYNKCALFNPTYKNLDFCIKICKEMAKQAAKMAVA